MATMTDHFDFDAVPESMPSWDIQVQGKATPLAEAGVLYVGVDLPTQGGPSSYWIMVGQATIPQVGAVGLRVVEAPKPSERAEVYVGLNDGQQLVYMSVIQGEVFVGLLDNTTTALHSVPYVSAMHQWLRITYDTGSSAMDFQTSPDGVSWDSIGMSTVDGFDFSQGYVEAGIGSLQGPISDVERTAAMDDLFVCDDT
jgi:hypothetical protein